MTKKYIVLWKNNRLEPEAHVRVEEAYSKDEAREQAEIEISGYVQEVIDPDEKPGACGKYWHTVIDASAMPQDSDDLQIFWERFRERAGVIFEQDF